MNILITGARGQLGQDIVKACYKCKINTLPFGSQDLDITNYNQVLETIKSEKPDIIINCAAYNDVDHAETDWQTAYLVNGIGPKNLALVGNLYQIPLVHFSTDQIFNGEVRVPLTIADRPTPINKYGLSKLLGEQMVKDHAYIFYLIRVSWVFGAGNMNFVRKVLEWSESKDTIRVVKDQEASPTYTVDLAKATLDLIENGIPGIYHITNSGSCTKHAWTEHILNQIDWNGTLKDAKSNEFSNPAKRPEYSVLDNFGTEDTIGYSLPDWKDATTRFLKEINKI